tara:strand:+ start:538 stop:717 length:180 start_codon:yes stop_codon:yes gene_type:complete
MDNIKSKDKEYSLKINKETNKDVNILNTVIKILDKQVLNFENDPFNHFARMNNEEIIRE